MNLFLSSDPKLLPVVDAVELIARHIVEREEHPVLAHLVQIDHEDWRAVRDYWPTVLARDWVVVLDPKKRPAPNIALIAQERRWARYVWHAVKSKALRLYDGEGFRIEFSPFGFVKPRQFAQWLVDVFDKDVVLDGVLVTPTPVSVPAEPYLLKRELLVERYRPIWPSISSDLLEGSRNGLAEARVGQGIYDVNQALAWARTRGKLTKDFDIMESTPLNDLPGMDD